MVSSSSSIDHLDPETVPWTRIHEKVFERVLSRDEETKAYTRMVKFEPGAEISHTLVHDFFEEFIVIEGTLVDTTIGKTFKRGMYAFRRPGLSHGPFMSPDGCLAIEVRYYGREKGELDKGQ